MSTNKHSTHHGKIGLESRGTLSLSTKNITQLSNKMVGTISPGGRNMRRHHLELLLYYVVFFLSSLIQFSIIDSEG